MKKLITLAPKSPFDIKPDTLIFSDLHLHERNEFARVDSKTGLNSRLVEGLSILDQINDIIGEHPEILCVLNLGDVFELKNRIPNHLLLEYQKRINIENYLTLVGNHDFDLPNYPSIKLFDDQEQTLIISSPNLMGIWGFIPFQREQSDFINELTKMNELKPTTIFFHQELPGGEYESGKKIPGTFPSSLFDPSIVYISGHLHKHQTVGKVVYIGGPYQKNFSDEGCRKFIWLLNSKTREMASLELNYPKFLSFNIMDRTDCLDIDTGNYPPEITAGNYIRVIGEVESHQWTPESKKKLREGLEKAGALGVSFQVQVKRTHQSKIPENKIDDDDSIIKLYVDENFQETEINKGKLLKTGLEIFHQN